MYEHTLAHRNTVPRCTRQYNVVVLDSRLPRPCSRGCIKLHKIHYTVGALRPYHSGANTKHGGDALGSHESVGRPDLEEGQAEVDDHDPIMEDDVAVKV